MNYPELHLPKEIIENFNKVFPNPVEPILPNAPIKPSNGNSFLGFIAAISLSIIFLFIKLPVLSFIIFGGFLYAFFLNSNNNDYENALTKYNYELNNYKKVLEEYKKDMSFTEKESYQLHKRNRLNEKILNSSSKHIESKDYKKGISHNYFKTFLLERFGNSIVESVSINSQRNPSYIESGFNLYITDFAYIDKYTNLRIDIEIDEPYTFENQQPIHLNDNDRNDFFIQNNWVVIRFAEEQVIKYPESCCEYISKIINCFHYDFLSLKNLKSNIPEVKKWNLESVKILIKNDYRNSYLDGIVYVRL